MSVNPQLSSPSRYHPHPSPLRYICHPAGLSLPVKPLQESVMKEGRSDTSVTLASGGYRSCGVEPHAAARTWAHGSALGNSAWVCGEQGTIPVIVAPLQEHCVLAASALCGAAGESHKSSSTLIKSNATQDVVFKDCC